jgi:hypothetical protein
MRFRFAFVILAATSGSVVACAAERPAPTQVDGICGVSGSNSPDIRKAVLKSKDITFHENLGEYETFVDERNRRLWTFTRTSSKLPSSAICRTVVPKGSGSEVKMEIVCFGGNDECNALRDDWEAFLSSQLPAVQQ